MASLATGLDGDQVTLMLALKAQCLHRLGACSFASPFLPPLTYELLQKVLDLIFLCFSSKEIDHASSKEDGYSPRCQIIVLLSVEN